MNKNAEKIFERWKLPDNLREQFYEMADNFGLDLLSEYFDFHLEKYTKGYLKQLEEELHHEVLFTAKDWNQLGDILDHIFKFSELDLYGLFDLDDLMDKISRNRLVYFYECKETTWNKRIICCRGKDNTKMRWIVEAHKDWLKKEAVNFKLKEECKKKEEFRKGV